MVSRYVPPGIDVDVTCFIAEKGKHFNTDPNTWRKLARTVNAVSVPGTHSSILVAERDSLAKALAAALREAYARHASDGCQTNATSLQSRARMAIVHRSATKLS
jgi:thioesterase domain-containing protein